MQDTNPKSKLSAVLVGLLVVMAGIALIPAGAATATTAQVQTQQSSGYGVDIVYPDNFSVGSNQTIGVVVNNTGNSDDVFSPVVEVPLSSLSLSQSAVETAYVTYNGERESRRAEVQESTITSGQALFIFGENVPAGEKRTYYFNITVSAAGNKSITSEVRPLYNNNVQEQTTEVAYAKGYGAVSVSVLDSSGSPVTGASISVDGESAGTGSVSVSALEGEHTVSVSNLNTITISETTISIGPQETQRVTFIAQKALTQPGLLLRTGSAEVVAASVGQSVTTEATATQQKEVTLTFLLATSGGQSVFGVNHPSSIEPIQSWSVDTGLGQAVKIQDSSTEEIAVSEVEAGSDTQITVKYKGYKLGDATLDGAVTSDDAASVAQSVAAGSQETVSQYGDVNDDGQITPVDAMLIAQYNAGNRSATYGGA